MIRDIFKSRYKIVQCDDNLYYWEKHSGIFPFIKYRTMFGKATIAEAEEAAKFHGSPEPKLTKIVKDLGVIKNK